MIQTERHVHLFRNGQNQALRIPCEYELEGNEAIIRKEGNKLIVEPITKKNGLRTLLSAWEPLEEEFPDITDPLPETENIF